MAPWFPVAPPGEIQAWPDPSLLAPDPIETTLSCAGTLTNGLAGQELPSSSPRLDPRNPLVPVALSLPTGPNYGWSPYGFQNHDFQNQNLNQWPPSSLQSVVTQQGPNVPQHGLPQQHLSSFGNTPQLAQNPPGFSSTSHPLSGAEMDDIILATAFHDLSGGVPLISPSSPSSHAGWYPSSSEAHGFLESRPSYNHAVELRQNAEGALQRQNEPDVPPHGSAATAMHNRVSNEGASSSRKIYTTPEELEKYGQDRQEFVQEPEALHKFRYSASPFEDVPAPIGPTNATEATTANTEAKTFELLKVTNDIAPD
ncbi:uncharacterized protein UBRO2_03847 [Ustilago bromivora]|uniref:Uncharacterized protein n=1 Tax=Ustilago bromivora TaxID=307758 RepID=A0A8H8QNU1_9BASI|nr:uncharacterized protein UBRO2_03847 [Ustilago bromivora]